MTASRSGRAAVRDSGPTTRGPSVAARRSIATVAMVLGLLTGLGPLGAQWIPTRSLSVHDGLAQSQVTAIVHDSHGYLWVATQGGLSRGDGRRFVTFTTVDGLPDDVVTALAPADHGRVFLGTDSGAVALWSGAGFATWRGPGQGTITGLAWLGGDELLVGATDGLWRWSPEGRVPLLEDPVTAISVLDGLRSDDPWTWPLVLSSELVRTDGRRLETVSPPLALAPGESVEAVDAGRDVLWIGTSAGRVVRRRRGGPDETVVQGLAPVHVVLAARSGGTWIGSGDGLWRLDGDDPPARQPLVATEPGLEIRTLAEDRDGGLWASPWSGGLYVVDPEGFPVFNRASGFPTTQVWGFFEDRQGCVWMASEDVGAVRWCGDRVAEHLAAGRELPPGRTIAVVEDPPGNLWIATASGIVRRDPSGRLRRLTTADGLPDDYVRSLAVDRDGAVWAATRGGLARIGDGRLRAWTGADGLPDANLRGLAFDRRGGLWIASHGAGVFRFDGVGFEVFDVSRGLPHPRVWCVMVDAEDRVWAGTDAGLWVHPVDGGPDLTVSAGAGLPSLNVLFVVEASGGGAWLGTTRGLARIAAGGRVERVLSAVDGLVGSEASTNSALIDRAGHLWVGLAEGVTRIDPAMLGRAIEPPAVAVERVLVDGESVSRRVPLYAPDLPLPVPLVVGPKPSDVRLELAALSFAAPERVRLRFWLEGYEEGPGRPTDERSVTYRQLPPGYYRFHLAATTGDHEWSRKPVVIPLSVRPAWYQTGWFRALVSGLLAVAVAGAFVGRAVADRRRRRRLEREVGLRTAELAEANARIGEQNRRLEELSRTDPLTGLANRRALSEQLPLEVALIRREVERGGTDLGADYHGCAVYLLDLDHFKAVNDRWGHELGDRVLRAVSARLRAALREVDLVVRWGGEEILVLARAVDRAGTEALAGKLLEEVAACAVELPEDGVLHVTTSIGFVQYPLGVGLPLEPRAWGSLVDAADRMLYLAKERGRSRACGACREGAGCNASHEELLRDVVVGPESPPVGVDLVTLERPAPLPSGPTPRTVPVPGADS